MADKSAPLAPSRNEILDLPLALALAFGVPRLHKYLLGKVNSNQESSAYNQNIPMTASSRITQRISA